MSSPFRRLLLTVAVLGIPGSVLAQDGGPTLRYQVDQSGDLTIIGNTLGQDCASLIPGTSNPANIPAPLVGIVGACGSQLDDTGVDVFWRAEDDGGVRASTSVEPRTAQSVAVLELPPGAEVTYARLYWGALRATGQSSTPKNIDGGSVADDGVVFERPGSFRRAVSAEASNTARINSAAFPTSFDRFFYQSSADVTALVRTSGPGVFRVADVASLDFRDVYEDTTVAAWSLVVAYKLDTEPVRNIAIYDGLNAVSPNNPAAVTLAGFRVPDVGFDAKLAVVAYEGDNAFRGDSLNFSGQQPLPDGGSRPTDAGPLSDAVNPADNFFNSSRSSLGLPKTVVGDLPQLSGAAGSMGGIDIDFLNVTPRLRAGATRADVTASSTQDVFLLGVLATSIATYKPVFSTSLKTAINTTVHADGSFRPGDVLEYTLTVPNTGNDDALDPVLTDELPLGLDYVAGSLRITAGSGTGTLTDGTDGDRGEAVTTSGRTTLTVRVGTVQGSQRILAVGESATVKFKAQVRADAANVVPNQGFISFKGVRGAPLTRVGTGSPDGPFSPTNVTISPIPVPAVTTPAPGNKVKQRRPLLAGTGEAGATVTVQVDGATVCTVTVTQDGLWSCAAGTDLLDGSHTVTATQRQGNGPESAASVGVPFTVDATPPDTTITSGPASRTRQSSATFAVTATDPNPGSGVDHLECSLDGAAFTPCSLSGGAVSLTNVSNGQHTLLVRAVDAAGNADPTPATWSWNVDPNAPGGPTIDTPPNGSVINRPPTTIAGTATPGSTVNVQIDGQTACQNVTVDAQGNWSCAPTGTVSDGPHTISVTARDPNGVTAGPVTSTFTLDTKAPETTITSRPPARTNSPTAQFAFTSDESPVTYECRLDNGAWAACPASYTLSGLANGSHTLEVRAVDRAGNKDATPASATWTIAPPGAVVITSPANGSTTNDKTPTITGTGEAGTTVVVKVDGAVACPNAVVNARGEWTCDVTGDLAEGSHTIEASPPNGTPGTSIFTVDTTPPETNIVQKPPELTASTTASFEFDSNDPDATFECSLDGGPWTACNRISTFTDLAEGDHSLSVRAKDKAGNVDPSPANAVWRIDPNASTNGNGGAGGNGSNGSAGNEIGSVEGGGLFGCTSAPSAATLFGLLVVGLATRPRRRQA